MSELKVDEKGMPYLEIPWSVRRKGQEVQVIVPGMTFDDFKNEPLAQAIIKGHQYARLLESGKFDTVLQLAQALKHDRSATARILSLVNLAPEIVNAVFDGSAPESLTLQKAMYGFPDDWEAQRKFFGYID